MNKFAVLLITVSVFTSGCTAYGTPDHDPDPRAGVRQPVDQNRNGVPDALERKAVPMEPVIARPAGSGA